MSENKQPLVTAVITTYKRNPEIVKRALDSIVGQTYENIEIYVVNDYPTDQNLVEELGKMVKASAGNRSVHYVVVEKNGGACKARNIALKRAEGKYFACLDDDDEWMPEKIELQVKTAESKTNIGIVYCNAYLYIENENKERIRFKDNPISSTEKAIDAIAGKNIIGSCSFPLFLTQSLRDIGGFREDMPALQDWELYLRLLRKKDIAYVEKPVARYYFYEGERISAHPENRTIAYEKIHEEIKDVLFANAKSASSFYLMGTYLYSLTGDTKKAFEYYCKGVKKSPFEFKRNCYDFVRMVGRRFIKPSKV